MPKRKCSFTNELQEKYPCFRKGEKDTQALCEICACSISVANSGACALKEHIESEKHKGNIRNASQSKSIDNFVIKTNSTQGVKTLVAEGVLAFHTVKHHMSYKSMDCTSNLLRTLFDDSNTAKKISCARTKTEAIVNEVLSPHSLEKVQTELLKIPFIGVGTDSSNHGDIKLFPIVIQFFDAQLGVQVRIIDLKESKNETAMTISTLIMETLQNLNLSKKLIAFVADNTNTNMGGLRRGGEQNVLYLLKKELNPHLLGIGCSEHIVHNAVQAGLDQFGLFDIDCLVVKIFNYFSIYTVRTNELKEFCEFVDIEYRKLLRHVKTRWLSLFPSVHRLLQMYDGLKSYFLSISKPPVQLKNFFEHDLGECFLWFVHSLMSIFHEKMLILEKKDISILEIVAIIEKICVSLSERINSKFVPLNVKTILMKLRNDGKDSICDDFMARVLIVYENSLDYLKKWTDQFSEFNVFSWLDLNSDTELKYDTIEKTVIYLKEKEIVIDDSKLFDQFINLKKFSLDKRSEPDFFTQTASCKMTAFFLSNKNQESYSEILKIAQFFFAIPAHNANCERIFSLIKSQWTNERNRCTVENIRYMIMVQVNFSEYSCESFKNYLLRPENLPLVRKIGSSQKYNT